MSRSTSSLLLLLLAVQAAAFPSDRLHARSAPCLRTGHDRAPSGWRTEERRRSQVRAPACCSSVLRLRGGGAARAGARSVAAVPEETGLRGDYGTLALLLLLYTLQGIPMGLSAVVPFLLAEKKVGSLEQAVFSVVQYPFALKLLWAPLVDSVYSRWVGRRLSWILPVQPAIGALMLYSSGRVEALLSSGQPDVKALAGIFLALYLLAATQDIAVDGLALTALSPRNRELAATCNAVGQSAGYLLAYAGFLYLSARGLCTIGGFMAFWGWAFLASTLAVLAARGRDEHDVPQGGVRQMRTTYLETRRVLRLPAVRSLGLMLLTMRAPLAAFEHLVPLELVKLGVPKEKLAAMNSVMLPVSMATQACVSRYFVEGATPMTFLLRGYKARLAYGGLATLVVAAVAWAMRDAMTRQWLPPVYAAGLLAACAGAAASAVVFVAQMALFNRVADPRIGGTYMTMLNTLANLGGQWPGTLVLATKGAIEALPGQPNGFYAVSACSVGLGLLWLQCMQGRARALQARPREDWLASEASEE